MSPLHDKTVIVTGASGGLGRAIAVAFAKCGAKVGLIARSEEGLVSAQREIADSSNAIIAIAVADMSDPHQISNAVVDLIDALGTPDIWVNNAMETVFSRFTDIAPEEFRRVTEVTYLGYVFGTQEALKHMQPLNRGHIIQVGSALAYRSIPLQSAYCGAKFAIRGFTDSLRCELIHDGSKIQLTTVHMPALNTPQFSWARTHIARQPKPVGTIFEPELGAWAVVQAALYPRREYWVGGSTVAAIWGTLFFPAWLDRKMARECYEQQWVAGKERPVQDGNLFQSKQPSLHTTRGKFSAEAKTHSITWTLTCWLSRLFTKKIN